MKHPLAVAASIITLMVGCCAPSHCDVPSAEVANTIRLRSLIAQAVSAHAKQVTIPPGTYRLGLPKGETSFLTLSDLRDFKIAANGVHLICTKCTRAIEIQHCQNTTLEGITVDYDPLPFTQGDIVAIADDKNSLDVKIHAGYPCEPNSRIDIVDPKTRYRKKGMPFLWGTKSVMIAPDVVRVTLKGIGNAAAVGDLASLSRFTDPGGIPHAVSLDACSRVTLRGVTVFASPSMGIIEFEGDGANHFDGCRVIPGPRPIGATEDRILSTNHDAMQSSCPKVGPLVENCEIRDAGDDSWSVQSSDYRVVAATGDSLVLGYGNGWTEGVQVGDHLRKSLDSPMCVVTERKWVDADPAWAKAARYLQVRVTGDVQARVGEFVADVDRMGNGFVFRNNRTRSSGRVLIKAAGLVENNVLDTPHALVVNPETANPGIIDGLTIRNNKIIDSGYFCPGPWSTQAGAISVASSGHAGLFTASTAYDHVLIEGNILIGTNGPGIVVASARNVTVRGNKFIDAQQVKPATTGDNYAVDHGSLIYLSQCSGVLITKNLIQNAGPFLTKAVGVGPNVTGLKSDIATAYPPQSATR